MSPLARSLTLLPLGFAIAFAAPAIAQQVADPDVNAFVCQLGGCDTSTAQAVETAPPEHPGARSSATRGFTFKRVAPSPTGGSTVGSGVMASAAAPAQAMPARPMSANLRLDFASASADLNDGSRQRLAKLAAALGSPRLAAKRIRIEGHTDANGNPQRNRMLSQRRAQAAADYLVSSGVARGRIEVVGYGADQPLPGLAATAPENRRVMATVLN